MDDLTDLNQTSLFTNTNTNTNTLINTQEPSGYTASHQDSTMQRTNETENSQLYDTRIDFAPQMGAYREQTWTAQPFQTTTNKELLLRLSARRERENTPRRETEYEKTLRTERNELHQFVQDNKLTAKEIMDMKAPSLDKIYFDQPISTSNEEFLKQVASIRNNKILVRSSSAKRLEAQVHDQSDLQKERENQQQKNENMRKFLERQAKIRREKFNTTDIQQERRQIDTNITMPTKLKPMNVEEKIMQAIEATNKVQPPATTGERQKT